MVIHYLHPFIPVAACRHSIKPGVRTTPFPDRVTCRKCKGTVAYQKLKGTPKEKIS